MSEYNDYWQQKSVSEHQIIKEICQHQYQPILQDILFFMCQEFGPLDIIDDVLLDNFSGNRENIESQKITRTPQTAVDDDYIRSFSCSNVQRPRRYRPRSNSITGPGSIQLDPDQITIMLLDRRDPEDHPVYTKKQLVDNQINYSENSGAQAPSTLFVTNQSIYDKYEKLVQMNEQLINQNKLSMLPSNTLKIGGRQLIASPIVSGASQFNTNTGKYILLNLTQSHLDATYAALVGSLGFQFISTGCTMQQKLTEVLYGSAASISSVLGANQNTYLQTIDPISLLIIALGAENKILTGGLQRDIYSRTVKRCIPCTLLEVKEQIVENPDVQIIKNSKISPQQCIDDFGIQVYYSSKNEQK